jgi:hemerythrin-like domain-containing protein
MSQATDLLSEEHGVIERVLDVLEALASVSVERQKLDEEPARMVLDFIKTFADRLHHGKEEDELFTLMEKSGMSRDSGPLQVMLHEHDTGRRFVAAMEANLGGAASGDALALAAYCEAADGYVELLRSHIMKEDQVLYPMSDDVLSENDQGDLFKRFEALCDRDAVVYKNYLDIADKLIQQFGSASGCGGCSGCSG